MQTYFWIFMGGGMGSVLRFALSNWISHKSGQIFPLGTLAVNVSGCFAIGILVVLTQPEGKWMLPVIPRQAVILGLLGGYTTFSSFSLQTLNLARHGDWLYAGLNVLGSVSLCLIAVWLGFLLGQTLNRS